MLPTWLTPAIVVAACAFVFWQLKPGLFFTSTTPTGGDLGGHVFGPAELRDYILPRLSGWSPDFGGFPAYVFYMPLPALVVLLFSVVLPYGMAFKLAIAMSAVVLPLAAWAIGRLSRMPAPIPACLAVAVLPFLFDDSYFRFGGNIVSSVIGEFSNGMGVPVALVALGVLDLALRTGRWRAAAAVLAAVAALCHPIVALMMVVCGGLLVAAHALEAGMVAVRRAAPVLVLGPLMVAFWFLPFLGYRSEQNPIAYSFSGGVGVFFPLPPWAEALIVGLAVAGVVRAVRSRHPVSLVLVGTAALCALAILILPGGLGTGWETHQLLVWTTGRMLPFFYLSVVLLAGIGAGDLALRAATAWSPSTTVVPLAGLVVAVMAIAIITGTLPLSDVQNVPTPSGLVTHSKWLFLPEVETSLVPLWVGEAFTGYEGQSTWPQYHAVVDTMAKVGSTHGCGRAMAEDDPSGIYGSVFEFALLPYWTHGCIDDVTGTPEVGLRNYTYVELARGLVSSSATTHAEPGVDFYPLDVRRGIPLLRALGVRYYMAFTPMAKSEAGSDRDLTLVATSGPWNVYEIHDVALVVGLTRQPVVVPVATAHDALQWLDATAPWFVGAASAPRPAAGGPPDWARVDRPSDATRARTLPPVTVSRVAVEGDRVSFHVDRVGVPVEVRVTYFPWWRAQGAQGPWRLAPDDLVVVPTSHDVVLTAAPRLLDHVATATSVLGVVGAGALALWDRRRRTRGPVGGAPAVSGEPGRRVLDADRSPS